MRFTRWHQRSFKLASLFFQGRFINTVSGWGSVRWKFTFVHRVMTRRDKRLRCTECKEEGWNKSSIHLSFFIQQDWFRAKSWKKKRDYTDILIRLLVLSLTFQLSPKTFFLCFYSKVCLYTLNKFKQFPNMPEYKFRKITLYYKNISLWIRVLGLFGVDVANGAASQLQSEASL